MSNLTEIEQDDFSYVFTDSDCRALVIFMHSLTLPLLEDRQVHQLNLGPEACKQLRSVFDNRKQIK